MAPTLTSTTGVVGSCPSSSAATAAAAGDTVGGSAPLLGDRITTKSAANTNRSVNDSATHGRWTMRHLPVLGPLAILQPSGVLKKFPAGVISIRDLYVVWNRRL